MPYIVLAFGLGMSFIGILSIVFGYPIIRDERGWTTVIAGSTLLAGGAITVALGLILKAIKELQPVFAGAPLPVPLQDTAFPRSADVSGLELPPGPSTATSVLATAMPAEIPAFAGPAVSLHEPARDVPTPDQQLSDALAHEASSRVAASQAIPLRDEPADISAYDLSHEPSGEPSPSDPSRGEHPRGDPPERPEAVAVAATNRPPDPVPSMDDWLDQSFADFDRETGMGATSVEPETPSEVPAEPEHVAELEPEIAPTLEAPTSAVIGRYDADGTSYTMYADGSIEAQSAAGVYRFASMADLKAYIEG